MRSSRGANVDDAALARRIERRVPQRNGEDLIRPQRRIVAVGPVDHVVAVTVSVIPKSVEAGAREFRELGILRCRLTNRRRHRSHALERVVPKRGDLYRLSHARRHDPVVDFGIHPGELHAGRACNDQSVGIHVDVVPCPVAIIVDNARQRRPYRAQRLEIAGRIDVRGDGLDVPERGVDGVVLGRLAGFGEKVRQHAAVDIRRKGEENLSRDLVPARHQRQPRQ